MYIGSLLHTMWPGITKIIFKYAFWSSAKEQAFYLDKIIFSTKYGLQSVPNV